MDTYLNSGSAYGYDDLNRLTGVSYPDIGLAYTMSYDRYGNRWSQTATQGSVNQQVFNFTVSNNQNTGFGYDAAGNQTYDGFYPYTYDAEGNVTGYGSGSSTAAYTYDALNHRTRDVEGGTSTFNVYDLSGHRVLTYDGNSGNLTKINVYWGNRFIAAYTGGQVYFQHSDVLGTVCAVTNSSGSTAGTFSSLPFGDGYTPSGTDVDALHFSELDHDTSRTEHAQFRQYNSAQGRWMSPDPYDGSYRWRNPQSLNRYTYALNNPLTYTDPSGLLCEGARYPGYGPDGTYNELVSPPPADEATCDAYNGLWIPDLGGPIVAPGTSVDVTTEEPSFPVVFGDGLDNSVSTDTDFGPGGGQSSAPGNTPPKPCFVQRIEALIPGAQYLGPGNSVGGHQQYLFSAPIATLNPYFQSSSFSLLGHANGIRLGGVLHSLHANDFSPSAQDPSATLFETHGDLFNPATGLLGLFGHGVVDYGIGKIPGVNLDGKC